MVTARHDAGRNVCAPVGPQRIPRDLVFSQDDGAEDTTMRNDTAPADLKLRLPADASAPRRARSALAAIEPLVPETLVEDLRLLVTEVVTNSVRHAGMGAEDEIALSVTVLADRVLVETWDSGPGYDTSSRLPGEDGAVPGLGLFLVDLLAKRWGAESGARCHTWFELDLSRR